MRFYLNRRYTRSRKTGKIITPYKKKNSGRISKSDINWNIQLSKRKLEALLVMLNKENRFRIVSNYPRYNCKTLPDLFP